jgi:hypothetical protein
MDIIADNLRAVASYWWILVAGGVLPFLDVLSFLHPKNREVKLHPSLRIGIAALAIVIAELLAYRDQSKNLTHVVEDKRLLSIQINSSKEQLDSTARDRDEAKRAAEACQGSETSLKKRALHMADDYEKFWRNRAKHAPTCNQTPQMTPQQQQATIAPCAKYEFESEQLYGQTMGPAILGMVYEFRAKGIDVKNIENCAGIGYCGLPLATQLRAFASLLDAKDNVKR